MEAEKDIKDSLVKVHEGLHDLTVALIGDEKYKRKGIVHDIEEMKDTQKLQREEIDKIKNRQVKAVAVGTGVGIGAGWGLKSIYAIAKTWLALPFK